MEVGQGDKVGRRRSREDEMLVTIGFSERKTKR
jgi:hypothetical protein